MKTKQAAIEAARKKLGSAANEGVDFNVHNTGAGWTWKEIEAANEPAKKAKAKRAPKAVPAPVEAPTKAQKMLAAKTAKPKKAKKGPMLKPKAPESRKAPPAQGTKSAALIALLKRPGGASSKEMEEATGWKASSVRGLLGTMRAQGSNIESKKLTKGEPTVYKLHEAKTAPAPDVGDVV